MSSPFLTNYHVEHNLALILSSACSEQFFGETTLTVVYTIEHILEPYVGYEDLNIWVIQMDWVDTHQVRKRKFHVGSRCKWS